MALTPTPDDLAYFGQSNPDEAVRPRILMERAVIRKAVTDLIAAGCLVRVHDGEDFACEKTQDLGVVMEAIMSTDEDELFVYPPERANRGALVIRLIYGNDGWDVICDYSLGLEDLLAGANELAEQLSEQAS